MASKWKVKIISQGEALELPLLLYAFSGARFFASPDVFLAQIYKIFP